MDVASTINVEPNNNALLMLIADNATRTAALFKIHVPCTSGTTSTPTAITNTPPANQRVVNTVAATTISVEPSQSVSL